METIYIALPVFILRKFFPFAILIKPFVAGERKLLLLIFSCMIFNLYGCNHHEKEVEEPQPAEKTSRQPSDIWVRPVEGAKDNPCWGFKDGIQIGLAPLSGPRGLIRLYAPYAGQPQWKAFNFIAFEPINHNNVRGLSELEHSKLDGVQGLRFWSGNSSNASEFPNPQYPASGRVRWEKQAGTGEEIEKLEVYIFSEMFDNGANVYVKVTFTAGRPYEIELTTYHPYNATGVKRFVLSATMGNYSRLRQLHLKDGQMNTAPQIWPSYRGDGFTGHHVVNRDEMITDAQGRKWFIASPSEEKPWEATYAYGTAGNWIYLGTTYVTQYWRCPQPHPTLAGQVNGRYCYWLSASPIPGGIAFENFELTEDFQFGATYCFGLYPGKPEGLISKIEHGEY
jgi:hypothetical protein